MSAHLTSISPQFLVDDLDVAISYYRDKLGFEHQFTHEGFYAAVSRDGLSIHLKRAPRLSGDRVHRRQGEHLDAYVNVKDVRGLHRELEARGARIVKAIEERPWGVVDFYVEDADGYILCFSEPASSGAKPAVPSGRSPDGD
jgi:catechol 2,3-dioxygenase-like lactoylglutathione lyase family enzyme